MVLYVPPVLNPSSSAPTFMWYVEVASQIRYPLTVHALGFMGDHLS
jgi:hypothetical protein